MKCPCWCGNHLCPLILKKWVLLGLSRYQHPHFPQWQSVWIAALPTPSMTICLDCRVTNTLNDNLFGLPRYQHPQWQSVWIAVLPAPSLPSMTICFLCDSDYTLCASLALCVLQSTGNSMGHRADIEMEAIECIWVVLTISKTKPSYLGCLCRNPASSHEWPEKFINMMDKATENNVHISLLGDFNINTF